MTTVTGLTPDALTPIQNALTAAVSAKTAEAQTYADEARAAAEAAGLVAAVFDTDAEITASGYAEGDLALVLQDATQSNDSALYRREGGAWVFKRRYFPSWMLDWLAQEPVKNKQGARRFFSRLFEIMKLGSEGRVGIAYYGDSVSNNVFSGFTGLLRRMLPCAAETYPLTNGTDLPFIVIIPAESSGSYVESRSQTIDQSSYDGAGGTVDFRYLPSGCSILMQAGAVVTLGTSDPGFAQEVMVHFFGRTGDGVATVEILNQSLSTVFASQSIDLDGAGATKIAFTGLSGAMVKIRITLAGGPGVMTGAACLKPYGFVPLAMGIGGSTFDQNNHGSQEMFDLLCDDYEVKLFFVQAKDETADSTDFRDALDRLQGRSDASVIICGDAPDQQDNPALPNLQDIEFAAEARARDMVFLDQRRIFRDYATISGLGWMIDGTHPNQIAWYFAASHLMTGLGMQALWNMLALPTIRGDVVEAGRLDLMRYDGAGYETVLRDANNGGDPGSFMVQFLRSLIFNSADGTPGATLSRYGAYGLHLQSGDSNPGSYRADRFLAADVNSAVQSIFGLLRVRQLHRHGGTAIMVDEQGRFHLRSFATSAFADPGSDINAAPKAAGAIAYDSQAGVIRIATGANASDPWLPVANSGEPLPAASAASFADAADPVNTTGKAQGVTRLNSTNTHLLVASGATPTAPWVDQVDGTTIVPS